MEVSLNFIKLSVQRDDFYVHKKLKVNVNLLQLEGRVKFVDDVRNQATQSAICQRKPSVETHTKTINEMHFNLAAQLQKLNTAVRKIFTLRVPCSGFIFYDLILNGFSISSFVTEIFAVEV